MEKGIRVAKNTRMACSKSTGGIIFRGADTPGGCCIRAEESHASGDFTPSSVRGGSQARDSDSESSLGDLGCVASKGEEVLLEKTSRRKIDTLTTGSNTEGRGETLGSRADEATSGSFASDWLLQSCDDADDRAVRRRLSMELLGAFYLV